VDPFDLLKEQELLGYEKVVLLLLGLEKNATTHIRFPASLLLEDRQWFIGVALVR